MDRWKVYRSLFKEDETRFLRIIIYAIFEKLFSFIRKLG